MTFVAELEPRAVWGHFDEILTIPRPSKGEEAMRRYVVAQAEAKGREVRRDRAGNVVVVVPATPGHEGAPVTVLQSHLDMVQEKNSDVDFDFAKDAIRPVRDGEYLTADGTTLGSDNGIGVAAMLAVLDGAGPGGEPLVHGPLELLFTVDEESGLTGAGELDGSLLTGRRLLNLDTEEEGSVYVGCAGGGDSLLRLPLAKAAAGGGGALQVRVSGLRGGHSGVDIHLQRGNALSLLARALWAAHRAAPLRVAALSGGSAHNAIPREARATVVAVDATAARAALEREGAAVAAEFAAADPGFRLAVEDATAPAEAWDEASSERALALLVALPHGVLATSQEIPDLVETSNNVAVAAEEGGALTVLTSTRSSVASALAAVRARIAALGRLADAEVEQGAGYPGWKPNLDSPLLATVKAVHARVLGNEPAIKAIHAGLETGIIGEKVPGIDMVSIGPQIEFPHSPDERVHVGSVERFWRLLTATLAELA
ncbi:MAG TPA: aminoacyl-histidine dipeptidase [Thermoanaerobaculia bacterium]|nr:aminoacyl-histidine dipeptidase [Thermoanaerobaculia bacterium]